MAGFNSIAAAAIGALNVANTVAKAYDSYQDNSGMRQYEQEKAMKNLEFQQAQQKAVLEKDRVRQDALFAEDERRKALRSLVAEQRAKYGASGTGSVDGSGQALLLGLFEDSEDKRENKEAQTAFDLSEIEQNLGNSQRINTLQLAQLKERKKLKKATSILDSVRSVF